MPGVRRVVHARAAEALREDRNRQYVLDYAHIKTAVDIACDEWEAVVADLTFILVHVIEGCACDDLVWQEAVMGVVRGKAALRDE